MAMDTEKIIKNAINVGFLLGLIFILLFVATYTGVMKCAQLPILGEGWCSVYWGVKTYTTGAPKVLIVYGTSGLGNPVGFGNGSLEEILSDPEILAVHADTLPVDRVSFGTLRNYDIVIVDRARRIETREMRAFIDYATQPTGGVLVWTGDAGTELGPRDQYLWTTDKDPDDDYNRVIGPWSRRDGDQMILFDELIGVRPLDNNAITFCSFAGCKQSSSTHVGSLEAEPTASHPLIRGISRTLPLYVFKGEDFAVVETISGAITTEVLSLDFGGDMTMPGHDLNQSVPLIVTTGIGERVIYYSMPPEYFANPRLTAEGKDPYFLPIENMYYGILKG